MAATVLQVLGDAATDGCRAHTFHVSLEKLTPSSRLTSSSLENINNFYCDISLLFYSDRNTISWWELSLKSHPSMLYLQYYALSLPFSVSIKLSHEIIVQESHRSCCTTEYKMKETNSSRCARMIRVDTSFLITTFNSLRNIPYQGSICKFLYS